MSSIPVNAHRKSFDISLPRGMFTKNLFRSTFFFSPVFLLKFLEFIFLSYPSRIKSKDFLIDTIVVTNERL